MQVMSTTQAQFKVGSGGLLYLLVSGVLLVSAFYTQANLLFWAFGLMVGGLVMSVGLAAVALRGLDITRTVPTHCAAGEPLPLRYEVRNRSWLPAFAVVLRENWGKGPHGWKHVGPASGAAHAAMLGGPPQGWLLHLGPGQTTQTQSPCRPRRRGRLVFERIEISTSFPFGVLHKTVAFDQNDEVLVFPYLYRVRRRLLSNLAASEGDGRRTRERPGGAGEFFGLREYRPGDGPRMIDWKRTARTGQLVAREMTMPRPPSLSLVLDLRETPPMSAGGKRSTKQEWVEAAASGRQLEERAISLTASLICDAYLLGLRVGLRVMGPGCPTFVPRHSLRHRTRLLEALAEMDLNHKSLMNDGADHLRRADVVVWAGRGSIALDALSPHGSASQAKSGAKVLGAADFDRYVTRVTALTELDQAGGRGQTVANGSRGTTEGRRSTSATTAVRGGRR